MKNLSILLEELITELTASEIKDKYYADVDDSEFTKIVSSDPKTKVKNGKIKKIGKYSKILLDMFRKGKLKLEDLSKANEYLTIVYKKQIPLNSDKITTLPDMYDVVKDHIVQNGETDINKLIDSLEEEDYTLLHNGEKWLIFQPKTERGACILGSATQWCTSWGKYSTNPKYKDRKNYFSSYGNNDKLYTIINKKDNSDKYQFHVPSSQYMDKYDKQINVSYFLEQNDELLYFFNPELKGGDFKKGGLSDIGEEVLDSMINRKLITKTARAWVIEELIDINAKKPIVAALLKAEEDDSYDKVNELLSDDFQIRDIAGEDIEFYDIQDEDLSQYDRMNSHYYDSAYNDYGNEEANYYYDNSMEEMFNQKKENLEMSFHSEGVDIKEFLQYLEDSGNGYNSGDYDYNFLDKLIVDSSKKDRVLTDMADIISEADREAHNEATSQVANKADGLFNIGKNEIEKSIFMLFLIRYDDYDMDDFKSFLENTFDIATEYYQIDEDIRELQQQMMNVDINEITDTYDRIDDDIVEWFLGEYEDEIVEFNQETDEETKDWFNEIPRDEYESKLREVTNMLLNIVYKHTNSQNMFMSNKFRVLQIMQRNINILKKTVYIKFDDKISGRENPNTYQQFSGYVKISELPKYITYGESSGPFWEKLTKIISDMNLDPEQREFENDIVTLKLDYGKFNIATEKIFVELTNKKSNKTVLGNINHNIIIRIKFTFSFEYSII